MKKLFFSLLMAGLIYSTLGATGDSPIMPVPFTAVQFTSSFWGPRLETNRTVTIPFAFKKCEETGRIDNFAVAGKLQTGTFRGLRYDDSDVYKIIEGASYSLTMHPDSQLDHYLDGVIAKITAAQEPDGYLYTIRTILGKNVPKNVGPERWSLEQDSHELYNVGHMYEAAVAHYLATGKKTLLSVALKNADLLVKTFGPDKLIVVPGHQEVEIGLVKLFRLTGEKKYLDLARFFLDYRGRSDRRKLYEAYWMKPPESLQYSQDFLPVTQQTEAVGHAVRAGYLYAGMADVAAQTGDQSYVSALQTIWNNVTGKKLYLTGGVGSSESGENYGTNYDLPNAEAYNETCAAIALMLWNNRMFLLTGEARFMDVLERSLYNGFLSGIALQGDRFFYPNPLASDGKKPFNENSCSRVPWFECSCCPSNIVRFLPSLPGYIYAVSGQNVYLNLFIAGRGTIRLSDGNTVQLLQQTDYPWNGAVKINVASASPTGNRFNLLVRIPGWALDRPLPSDLYRYDDGITTLPVILKVNNQPVSYEMKKGYAVISRTWKTDDTVTFELPMAVRLVRASDKVAADRGKVAFERGPLVYCAEGVDNGGKVLDIQITGKPSRQSEYKPDLLGGIVQIHSKCRHQAGGTDTLDFTLIPYFAWSHRGNGEMAVWFDHHDK